MNLQDEPKNSRSCIFQNSQNAISFIVHHGLLKMICIECSSKTILEEDTSYSNNLRMRCTNSHCRHSEKIFAGLKNKIPKIDFCEYIFIVYSWVEKNFGNILEKNSNVSLSTIKRIKRQIIQVITKDNSNFKFKLGKEHPVQVDESIIVKGKILTSPSQKYDQIKNSTWIVGIVEEKTRNLVLKIVPNRKKRDFFKLIPIIYRRKINC
ncbi:hypothetical protein DMUE_3633 [Dictyocoela muelleri]|nr:hypothetical protein DMUE_3633 [Dictyocoela muelleri]